MDGDVFVCINRYNSTILQDQRAHGFGKLIRVVLRGYLDANKWVLVFPYPTIMTFKQLKEQLLPLLNGFTFSSLVLLR